MYWCTYDSDIALVNIEGKSIKIEEIKRDKMNPEYGVYAISPSGNKELICKHESYNYAKNLVVEIHNRLQGKAYNPSYVRRYNGDPNKTIWG